jgi:hypothetical protein
MENPEEEIRYALKDIRLEAIKASIFHSLFEGAIVLVISNYLLSNYIEGSIMYSDIEIPLFLVYSIIISLVFIIIDFLITYRSRDIYKMEKDNPRLQYALRTAKEGSDREEEPNIMEKRLYEDVLDELKKSSSKGFVNGKRFVFIFGLMFVMGGVSVGSDYTGFGLSDVGEGLGISSDGNQDSSGSSGSQQNQYDSLQDPDDVLGEEGEVTRGSDTEDIELRQSGSGSSGEEDSQSNYESDNSYPTTSSVEGVRSEYNNEEEIEDSDLVKEYNLRIREER